MSERTAFLWAAAHVYRDGTAPFPPEGEMTGLRSETIPEIGLRLEAYQITTTQQIVVAIAGTSPTSIPSLINAAGIGLAVLPSYQIDATADFVREINADYGSVALVGHSSGGLVAQLLAAREQARDEYDRLAIDRAVGFNSPGAAPFLPALFGNNIPASFENIETVCDSRDMICRIFDVQDGTIAGTSHIGSIEYINRDPHLAPVPVMGMGLLNPLNVPEMLHDIISYHGINHLIKEDGNLRFPGDAAPGVTGAMGAGLPAVASGNVHTDPAGAFHPGDDDVVLASHDEDESPIEAGAEEFETFQTSSPIVLDLDHDGIETQGLLAGAFFDHAGDGFAELTGWVGVDDGLLVMDRNGNGTVDQGGELFGNETILHGGGLAPDGYHALAEFDANADGQVDASDPVWAQLLIWRDADGDGQSAPGELHALAEVGVAAIGTVATSSPVIDDHGNEHRLVGTFARADGSTGETADVWFRVARRYGVAGEPLPVPADVAVLPSVRGYGTVHDLHQAIVRDTSGVLKAQVQQFIAEPDPLARTALLEPLLFRWTGSDGVDPASRGPHIDGRRLATLERIYGEAFVGVDGTGNPNAEVGGLLDHTFRGVAELMYAQLMVQSHLQDLWRLPVYSWDEVAGKVRGDLSAVVAELHDMLLADPDAGRLALGEFARTVRGLGVNAMVNGRALRESFAPLGEDLAWTVDSGGKVLLAGTAGDDTLTGAATDDALRGGDGHDILSGDDGDDVLYGGAGADGLIGGANEDLLDGGSGDDVLEGRRGHDRLWGGPGNDTMLGDAGDDALEGGEGDDALDGGEGNDTLAGGAGADTLAGRDQNDALSGGEGDDTLTGNRGADTLAGEAGNDVLVGEAGEDILDGGPGDDSLDGGTEGDTYHFARGGGRDAIVDRDTTPGNLDTIALGPGIAPAEVQATRAGDDLVLTLDGSADELRVTSWFSESVPGQYEVEEIRFADGAVWNAAALREAVLVPTEGPDQLTGYGTPDVLRGLGGDDVLAGGGGDDWLDGGAGNDVIAGNQGHDTVFGGAGADVLRGNEGLDILRGGDGDDGLAGDRDDDALAGEAGDDALDGGGGDDHLDGGLGNDVLAGGDGADSLDGGPGRDSLSGDDGDDLLRGGADLDVLSGNAGDDVLHGGDDDDVLAGGRDSDMLFGEAGHDRLDGGPGMDGMAGGPGDDTYIVDDWGDWVEEAPGEGVDTVESSVNHSLRTDVEHLILTGTAPIAATGNELDNRLTGNEAANLLAGAGGDDVLDGGAGLDWLVGGSGNDTYVLSDAGDSAMEQAGEGLDLVLSGVTYVLPPNVEHLTLTGTAAITGVGNELDNRLAGNDAANVLDGGPGDDVLGGGAGPDTLAGGAGNDILEGGAGLDRLVGGTGDDTYVIADAGDAVIELAGEGTDLVQSALTYTLPANVEDLALATADPLSGTGNTLNNRLTGNAASNTLTGGAGDDILDGRGAADTLVGGLGNDTYNVSDAGDTVVEISGQGTDTIQSAVTYTVPAHVERLTLIGTGAIAGTGNTLANVLTGNGAANRLNGGSGIDAMAGAAGDDTYVVDHVADTVTEAPNEGTDTIEADVTYALPANVERLVLTGSGAIDATGNALDNTLAGNSKNNVLDGRAGADAMAGGGGHDTYVVDDAGDTIVEAPNAGTDTIESAVTYALPDNVEKLILTGTAALNGTGNALNNTLTGNGGANLLDGGSGSDIMAGGAGNDTYVVDRSTDSVQEGADAGIDTILSSAAYTLPNNVENGTLTGAGGIGLIGNALANVLQGNRGANLLDGRAGNDTYLISRGGGQDAIQDIDTTAGNRDTLAFAEDLDPLDLVISRQASNLRVAIHGSDDRVDISAWYASPANQIEVFRAGDGRQILSAQVEQLIQAMAGYSAQSGLSWDQAVDQRPQEVEAILAAHWQPAGS